MNITTKDIIDEYNKILAHNKLPEVIYDYNLHIKDQIDLEQNLISSYQFCPSEENNPDLDNLDASKVKSEVSENFYNEKAMSAVSCMVNSINVYTDGDSTFKNERIKQYLNNIVKLGVDSAQGFVFTVDLKDAEKMFIVKVAQDDNESVKIDHEAFIAFYGTNKLRKQIFNFAYIHTIIKAPKPEIDNTGKVISWVEGNGKEISYAFYENIVSISFKDFTNTCSPEDFILYYLQVMLALKVAQASCGFSHDDLHYENVLMRKVPLKDFYLEYKVNGHDAEYIRSKGYIATLIDFGMSHIQLDIDNKTEHFGYFDMMEHLTVQGRIIEEYDNGKVLIKNSEITFIATKDDIISMDDDGVVIAKYNFSDNSLSSFGIYNDKCNNIIDAY